MSSAYRVEFALPVNDIRYLAGGYDVPLNTLTTEYINIL